MLPALDTTALTRPTSGALVEGRMARLERAKAAEKDDEVAREMEALFSQLLVKEMRRGLGEGFFGQGAGADTFESWLDEHLADSLARQGVLDLAGRVKASLDASRKAAGEGDDQEAGADEVARPVHDQRRAMEVTP